VVRVPNPERRDYYSVDNAIEVSLAKRGIASVEVVARLINLQDSDVLRNVPINCGSQFVGRYLSLNDNTRDLSFCVNACIGSSRSMNRDFPAFDKG
jgi:hypothetical protein